MSKLLKLKLALLAILTLDSTGKDHDRCLCSVTALRSDFTSSISNIDLVNDTCFVGKQAGCWFRFLQMCCSGLLSSETTWVRASSGALVWKHVICGCCRVTSQKRLSYRLQALSSLFFDVMPSILRIRLDGWFSRCRGQSSGKSASRQRVFTRCSREVPKESRAKRAFCDWRVVFNSPTWPCPRAACRIRLSVWGGAPPMSRLAGVEFKFCDISSLLGKINLSIFIHV